MTIDEFIERLQDLKGVDGVTGDTPVVVAVEHNDRFPKQWELAMAEVVAVSEKREGHDQNTWITEATKNNLGFVVSIV